MQMVNRLGLEIIKQSESLQLEAYLDDDKPKKWTIGWGHLLPFDEKTDRPVVVDWCWRHGLTDRLGKMSANIADQVLLGDCNEAEHAIRRLVKVSLTSNQFSALVSFVFNIGQGAFSESTLLRVLNRQQYTLAKDQFRVWNKAGGKVLNGLVGRRAVEAFVFSLPDSIG